MSLCINPRCLQPDHPENDSSRYCHSCGSELVLQGRYRVMRLLSDKSGFGQVYEAFERSIPKLLKVLKEIHNHNPKAVELFQKEASVLSQMHHPGVPMVQPDDYFQFIPRGSTEPLHCIVMEKIDGPNLKEWMRQQGYHPIQEQQAVQWLAQLAEILHRVHQKNYFHRDIKPENIMLRSSGQLVLVDFGAAREITYTYLAQLGQTGGITRISSAGYTPPEQERGQAVPQSDFYALGCTFIYLLTGKTPTDSGMYDPIQNQFVWRQFAPTLSPPFADFIDWLIAPKAGDRPKDTQNLLEAIAQLSRDLAMGVSVSPGSRGIGAAGVASIPTAASGVTVKQTPRPIVPIKWLVGGAIALVVGVGGYYGAAQLHQHALLSAPAVEQVNVTETLSGHTGFVNAVIFAPTRQMLISGSADRIIKIWNLETGAVMANLTGHNAPVNTLILQSDGQTLISGSADGAIKLWNLLTDQNTRTLASHTSAINDLVLSPDNQTLFSASADTTIKQWDLATGQELRSLVGHTSSVNALTISPDGQTLMSASADKTIKLWNLVTGEVRTLTGHTSYVNALAISPDGTTLFSGSADKTIGVWDLNSGGELRTLTGHTSYVNALEVSLDGRRLFSGSADGTIKLWSIETGDEMYTLTGYGNHINYFAVSHDGKTMATGSGEQDITLWQLPE